MEEDGDGEVFFAVFYFREVAAVEAGFEGQGFLRHVGGFAQISDFFADFFQFFHVVSMWEITRRVCSLLPTFVVDSPQNKC